MSEQQISRLRFLIKKKRAGLINDPECEELMAILGLLRKDEQLSSGEKVAAGVILATLIGKQKPKELTA